MTGIPNTFTAGEIASSSEVNDNFSALLNIAGSDSDADHLKPGGDIVLGPRRTGQITAEGDGGPGGSATFMQVSWNAELYDSGGGIWRLRRYANGENASAIRVGRRGVEVLTTHDTTSELTTAMKTALAVRPNATNPYIYVNPAFHFSAIDTEPNPQAMGQYRLQYVPIEPIEMFLNAAGGGTATYTASNFGIPVDAKALMIYSEHSVSTPAAPPTTPTILTCTVTICQARQEPPSAKYGFSVLAFQDANKSMYRGQGVVPLGYLGTLAGQFRVVYDAPPLFKTMYIQGYFV
jgi:hypothetical protein